MVVIYFNSELCLECGFGFGSLVVYFEVCIVLFEYLSMGIFIVLVMCKDLLIVWFLKLNMFGLSVMDWEFIFSVYIRIFKFYCDNSRRLLLKDIKSIILFILEMYFDNFEFLLFYI